MRKALTCIIILLSLLAFAGCENNVVDYSGFATEDEYYEITTGQAADILDEYMASRGIHVKRATTEYDYALQELETDKDFNKQIWTDPMKCYIEAYIGANVDSHTQLTDDGIPKSISGKKLEEYRNQ